MTLNIRGINESRKVDWIRRLKITHKLDFIGVQETRVADSNSIDTSGCWGSSNYECDFVNPTGFSGGIMSIWDPLVFCKSHSILKRHYIATSGIWKDVPGTTTFINVYGPQSITEKCALWVELLELKRNSNGVCIIFGDFNVVRYASEISISSYQMLGYMNSTLVEGNSRILGKTESN